MTAQFGVDIRELHLQRDREQVAQLDVVSTSATKFDVTETATGFDFVEVALSEPVTKQHDCLADLTDPDAAWEHAWVAVEDECVRGLAASGYQAWNRRAVLWLLLVDRAHCGRGIGRALVEHAATSARVRGARQLWLETQNTNVPAVRAYRAMGFSMAGFDRTLYDGDVADEVALYFSRALWH